MFVFSEVVPTFEVLIPETNPVVSPGSEARLTCEARTETVVQSIDWSRLDALLPQGLNEKKYYSVSYDCGFVLAAAYTTDDGTLVIPDCRPQDSGRYVCTIRLVTGETATAVATLTIDTSTPSTRALS